MTKQLLTKIVNREMPYRSQNISVWYCIKDNCAFSSQTMEEAARHEIRMIGYGNHETQLVTI